MNDDPEPSSHSIDTSVLDPLWRDGMPDVEDEARRAAAAALLLAHSLPIHPKVACEISLVLADDALLRELNRDYRQKDRATNVLSFPAWDEAARSFQAPEGAPLHLGDVFIARETLLREAEAQSKHALDHLRHLVVHGVFHLLGQDHQDEEDAEIMESLEVRALASLGVANPYHSRPDDDPAARLDREQVLAKGRKAS